MARSGGGRPTACAGTRAGTRAEQKGAPTVPLDAAAGLPSYDRISQGWGAAPRGHQYSVGIIGTFVGADSRRALEFARCQRCDPTHLPTPLRSRHLDTLCQHGRALDSASGIARVGTSQRNRLTIGCGWLTIRFSWMPFSACWWSVYDYTSGSKMVAALERQDLELLLLHPGTESTGEVIRDQLLRVEAMTGVPRAITHPTAGRNLLRRDCPLSRTVPARDSQR